MGKARVTQSEHGRGELAHVQGKPIGASDGGFPARAHFVSATRTALWAMIASTLLFSLADLRFTSAISPGLYAVKALQLAVALIALWRLDKIRNERTARIVIIACAGVICLLVGVAGVIADDTARAVILCLAIAWVSAVMIPWDVVSQLMVAAIAGASLPLAMWAMRGHLGDIAPQPALATCLALVASGLLAHQLAQQRRQRFAHGRARRQSLKRAVAKRTAQLRIANDALRTSERRLRVVSELTSDYSYSFVVDDSLNASLEWLTEASFHRITGFTADEIREHGGVILHRDDRKIAGKRMENLLAGHDDTSEFRIVTKSGEVRWIRDFGKAEWDGEKGRVVRIYGAAQDITARKTAEDGLRSSEELFRMAFAHGPVGIAMIDTHSRIVNANAALCDMLGYTADQLHSLSIGDITDPEDAALETTMLEPLLAGRRDGYEIDKRFHTSDGTALWAHVRVGLIRDRNKDPLQAIATIENITERRRTETALRASEKRFRVLAEQSSDVILLTSADGRLSYASPSLQSLIGYVPRDVLGRSAFDFVHAADREHAKGEFTGIVGGQGGPASTASFRVQHQDGSWRWVDAVGSNLLDAPGVGAIFMTLRDVSERRRAEEALERAQQQLAHILSANPVVLYSLTVVNGRAVPQWVSENITRVTGYEHDDTLMPTWWLEHVHPDDRPRVSLIGRGERTVEEYRFRHADRTYLWIRDEKHTLYDDKGEAIQVVGSWSNITERKHAEEAAQRGEERFRALIDRSLDLVAIVGPSGVYRYVNPTHETIYGIKPQDLIGTSFFDRLHPADAERLLPTLRETMQSGRTVSTAAYRLRDQAGSWRAFEGVALNLIDDPEIAGVLITGRDTTERLRGEQGAALLQFAQDMGDAYDLEKLLDRVHKRTASAVPCDAVFTFYRLPEHDSFELIADHGLSEDVRRAVQSLRFGATEPFGGRLETGDTVVLNGFDAAPATIAELATSFGIGALVAAPLTIQGRHLGSLVALRTSPGEKFDRHQVDLCSGIAAQLAIAIEALDLQRQQHEEAMVSAALARVGHALVSSLDTPQLLDRLCAITAEVLGCDASFTIVKSAEDDTYRFVAAHIEQAEEVEALRALSLPAEAFAELVANLEQHGLFQVATTDAPNAWAALPRRYGMAVVLYAPLRRGDEIIGIHAAALFDAQGTFSAQQERIARGIAELASLALENARLLKQLERANRLRSEFLSTMSHELLTPLNVIIGYTDLLVEELLGSLNSEQADGLQRVRINARELLQVIRDTLDLSRLETRHVPLALGDVELDDLIRQVDAETRDLQQQSGLTFVWTAASTRARIRTDPRKLRVVLKNLLHNAAKFTPHGTVTIDARACGDGIELTVADTGIGISEDALPIIFEPFRQGDDSSTRHKDGVGLGLHIVRRLVDILGGTIAVESELNRGSTFRLWLPQEGPRSGATDLAEVQAVAR